MSHLSYPEPPLVGTEIETMLGSLERQRATFWWKASDLDATSLSRRVGASQLTLGNLLKHLAYMEDINFHRDLGGGSLPQPWSHLNTETLSAWVFASADDDSPEVLYRLWHEAVGRSRAAVAHALAGDGAGRLVEVRGRSVSLRRLLVDMIEEYARHTGHADVLREAVDGRIGEDPPGSPVPYHL